MRERLRERPVWVCLAGDIEVAAFGETHFIVIPSLVVIPTHTSRLSGLSGLVIRVIRVISVTSRASTPLGQALRPALTVPLPPPLSLSLLLSPSCGLPYLGGKINPDFSRLFFQ